MEKSSRSDIRSLLKTFGIQADEAIVAHLARNPRVGPLHLRLQLTDVTDYGDQTPDQPVNLTVEGTIRPPDAS